MTNKKTKYKRDDILEQLRTTVLDVSFIKVNNEARVLRCTLRPEYLPESYKNEIHEENDYHTTNPTLIAAWDVQKGGWRSFHIDSVLWIQDVNESYP